MECQEYVYVGSGFESCCIYKKNFNGFEFWTGKEWSTDKEIYSTLCKQDDNINTIEELTILNGKIMI